MDWLTELTVRRSKVIRAAPDAAWQLLSSPAAWSLRPASYAFDVPVAPDSVTGWTSSSTGGGSWGSGSPGSGTCWRAAGPCRARRSHRP
jgi:hypothetical protein